MKAWISASSGLALANGHRRCASAPDWGDCTSGTQIWIGRIPWARNRWRCARTLRRLATRRASWTLSYERAAYGRAPWEGCAPGWPGRPDEQAGDSGTGPIDWPALVERFKARKLSSGAIKPQTWSSVYQRRMAVLLAA